MGTTYKIKANLHLWQSQTKITQQIQKELIQFSEKFSTYDRESDISLFNEIEETTYISFQRDIAFVLDKAIELYYLSDGAFDITVKPLFDIWGLDKPGKKRARPEDKVVQDTLNQIGLDKLEMMYPNKIRKKHPQLQLDVSALAKGYAVDQCSKVLNENDIQDFMVEIGGEVFVQGTPKKRDEIGRAHV